MYRDRSRSTHAGQACRLVAQRWRSVLERWRGRRRRKTKLFLLLLVAKEVEVTARGATATRLYQQRRVLFSSSSSTIWREFLLPGYEVVAWRYVTVVRQIKPDSRREIKEERDWHDQQQQQQRHDEIRWGRERRRIPMSDRLCVCIRTNALLIVHYALIALVERCQSLHWPGGQMKVRKYHL